MKLTKYYVTLVLLLFCINMYGQYFKKLDMKDGLSNLSVLAIYQDTLGRMWFGTNEGVNIYDGERLSTYKSYDIIDNKFRKKQFINGTVDHIVGDSHGDVFLKTDGALIKYDIRKERFKEIYPTGITSIAVLDNEVWCAVDDSLFKYNTQTDSLCFYQKLNTPVIWCMAKSGDKIWVGTDKGLYVLEGRTVRCLLPEVEIFKLFVSSRGELWIASRMEGLYRIGRDGTLKKEKHSSDRVVSEQIRDFVEDDQKNIWFGTFDGLQMYKPNADIYSVYRPNYHPGSLSHESVFSLFIDKQGTIWVGTYYGGVNYFNLKKDLFRYYVYAESNKNCLNYPIVGQIIEDKQHDLWICTDGGGVNCFNRKSGTFTYYTTESPETSILHDNVKTIAYDEVRDQVYIGTYTGGLSRYDKRTKRFHNYYDDYRRTGMGPDHIIYYAIFRDGWLYVTSRNGFWRMHPDQGEFQLICNINFFRTFEIDSRGDVWLAADLDLYRLPLNDWSKIETVHFDTLENRKVRITKIMEAKDGTVYVSTIGNGVFSYNHDTGQWVHYTAERNNLLSNFCYNLAESPLNNILITNDKGISIYSPFNHSMYSVELGAIKGMISAVADGGGICAADDDMVYIGGVDGMISFRERDLYKEGEGSGAARLYFASLFVNNAKIYPGDSQGILDQSLPFMQHIDLSSGQNNLMIDFYSSNYVELEKSIWYQYKLEGFDDDWVFTDQLRLTYTNLAPGNYVLKVRETKNRLGNEEGGEIALDIVIHYPWYRTFWAYLLYFLVVASIVTVFLRVRNARKALTLSLAKEKDEKERIEEVNKMKLRFFTNISHEFRTPLTLIIGQVDMLLQSDKLPLSVYRRLHSVHKNAKNLHFLITELLDFRKQEQGFMKLKVECIDIVPFLEDIYRSFAELARKRNIVYTFEHAQEKMDIWVDPVQMQKAVFNLLSNAFKYTQDGKSIKVSVRKLPQTMEIAVADTGCGIPQDDLSKIFERFYQGSERLQKGAMGSGIGLALTKGIIEAHKGDITVESVLEQGSCFKIDLPLGNDHFGREELEHEKVVMPVPDWEGIISDEVEPLPEGEPEVDDAVEMEHEEPDRPRILLVEDDEGVLDMLEGIFSPIYTVYKATNGQMGFEMTRQFLPDLVVSDVMMPVMSGKEMCYKIKNSLELAYIPVILLTAQSSLDYTIEGYMFGADDYVTKPFNVKLLLARCNSLLKNRKLLLERLSRAEGVPPQAIGGITAADQKLLEAATEVIKRNFDNPEFDMNMLAAELNMGRSKMFHRLKEVVGVTPNEFTLKLRLEEALRLLQEEPEYNISEISYRLGFTSPRYFSRCFKSLYGVAPLYYRKDSSKEDSLPEDFE